MAKQRQHDLDAAIAWLAYHYPSVGLIQSSAVGEQPRKAGGRVGRRYAVELRRFGHKEVALSGSGPTILDAVKSAVGWYEL